MKTVTRRLSTIGKLGLFAGLLFSGQQALAQDTAAGTDISNQAFVDFSVNSIPQTQVSSETVVFEVDRRVNYLVELEALTLTDATPGETDLFLPFTVTNESNDTLDFDLSQVALANGDPVRSTTATGETMDNVSIAVANTIVGGGDDIPVRGSPNTRIVSLAPTEQIRVYIWADAPITLPDGSVPAIELSVIAAEEGGAPLVDNSGDADDPTLVQNVFLVPANGSGNADVRNQDGFLVAGAAIAAVKDSEVLSDPFSTSNPKAIPGAIVQYSIALTNNGSADAEDVTITDTLDVANLTLVDDAFGTGQNVDLGDGTFCNADGDGTDGCTFNATTGALSIDLSAPLAGGATQTVLFQVQINQ